MYAPAPHAKQPESWRSAVFPPNERTLIKVPLSNLVIAIEIGCVLIFSSPRLFVYDSLILLFGFPCQEKFAKFVKFFSGLDCTRGD
jgi:hypothetical protein